MKNSSSNHYETNPITIIISGVKKAFTHSQQLAILLIVVPFAVGIINFVVQIFVEIFGQVLNRGSDEIAVTAPTLIIGGVLLVLGVGLQIFFQTAYVSLQAFSVIKIMHTHDAPFGTAVSEALSKFWKVLGTVLLIFIYALPYIVALMASILVNVIFGAMEKSLLALTIPLSSILGIFLIILLIRVYLRFNFATYALFDGSETITAALEKSKTLTRGRLSEVFGVRTLANLVPFINGVTIAGGEAVLYEQLKDARARNADLPKQHILNYLSLFIMGGVIILASIFILLIVAVTYPS